MSPTKDLGDENTVVLLSQYAEMAANSKYAVELCALFHHLYQIGPIICLYELIETLGQFCLMLTFETEKWVSRHIDHINWVYRKYLSSASCRVCDSDNDVGKY